MSRLLSHLHISSWVEFQAQSITPWEMEVSFHERGWVDSANGTWSKVQESASTPAHARSLCSACKECVHCMLDGPLMGSDWSKMASDLLFSVVTVGPGEGGTESLGWEVRSGDLSVWELCLLFGHFPGWPSGHCHILPRRQWASPKPGQTMNLLSLSLMISGFPAAHRREMLFTKYSLTAFWL